MLLFVLTIGKYNDQRHDDENSYRNGLMMGVTINSFLKKFVQLNSACVSIHDNEQGCTLNVNTLYISLQNSNNVYICVWIFLCNIACKWPCIEISQMRRQIWVKCDWSIRNHNKTLQDTNSMGRFSCIAYRQRCWKFALFRLFCRHKNVVLHCTCCTWNLSGIMVFLEFSGTSVNCNV